MNHAILVRSKLNECAEFHDADNLTCVDHARLNICHDVLDRSDRLVDHLLISTADIDCTVICDVDLNASLLDDLIDHFTLLADYIANLSRIDGDLCDLRSVLGQSLSRLADNRSHNVIHDVKSCFTAASDRLLDDRAC